MSNDFCNEKRTIEHTTPKTVRILEGQNKCSAMGWKNVSNLKDRIFVCPTFLKRNMCAHSYKCLGLENPGTVFVLRILEERTVRYAIVLTFFPIEYGNLTTNMDVYYYNPLLLSPQNIFSTQLVDERETKHF